VPGLLTGGPGYLVAFFTRERHESRGLQTQADAKLRGDDEALKRVEQEIQEAKRKIDEMHKVEGLEK
jgi:hypothetical protein